VSDEDHGAANGDIEGYEQLRRVALGGDASGWRLGLALLERRGVAAWTRAWGAVSPPEPIPAPAVPLEGRDGIVAVLASMALACLQAG
jgi:hypothetical protein